MSYAAALERLYGLEHSGIKLGLSRIEAALRDLGRPQDAFAAVHVAGTNGKGSTCAMMAGILQACGYATGLYTSPHLIDFRERIRAGGRMVEETWIVRGLDEIWPAVERHELSFFEATTCLAFWIFARLGVRIAVLEVGLGGRLDATNVVSPELTIITSLSRDHAKTLGETLDRIATEKAGIVKPGVPLILAGSPGLARRAVLCVALERGAPVVLDREAVSIRDLDTDLGRARWTCRRLRPELPDWLDGPWEISLGGAHQAENARLALLGAALLQERGWLLDPGGVREGLRAIRWPGRLEDLRPRWPVLLDVAHNPEGARRLVHALRTRPGTTPVRWVVGMVRGKEYAEFLGGLSRGGSWAHLASPHHQRCVGVGVLEGAARSAGLLARSHGSVEEALNSCLDELLPGQICVVTGSFFTLDEACRALGIPARDALMEPLGAIPQC